MNTCIRRISPPATVLTMPKRSSTQDPAPPRRPRWRKDDHHAVVVYVHQVFHLVVPFVVRLYPFGHELHELVRTSVFRLIRPPTKCPHLQDEVRSEEARGASSGPELAVERLDDLDVLPRHRPPSISLERWSRKGRQHLPRRDVYDQRRDRDAPRFRSPVVKAGRRGS
jgi:hypothetical protein